MASIYYSILYPPRLPIDIPAFELGKPSDTWRLYLEPSVGNKPSDFKGGFIRIRNSETEKSSLFPGSGGYLDGFLPFRNPFAEYNDLKDSSKSILQPPGYEPTIPLLQVNDRGEFYIDIKHEVFTLSNSPKDVKYKVQVMFSNDWISSSLPDGRGGILTYSEETLSYERIDTVTYFSGNLIQKGLSEWSTITRVAPVSEAKYEIQFSGENIFSPIYEFVGSSIESNLRRNNTPNYLKAYRINIFRSQGSEKELFVDSSNWVIGQDASNLEIRWQNIVELENNQTYIVELDIQTVWNLRKTFVYNVQTSFEGSLFKGDIRVINDHDNARAKIIMQSETPLTWGPRDSFDIDPLNFDYAKIEGVVSVEQGIDLYSKEGAISGEMILTGIKPIKSIEENPNEYFFKLSGPELTIHNPIQEEYTIYAHSLPLGRELEEGIPYIDDIVINPVIESPSGETYQTYLDSQIQQHGVGATPSKIGSIATTSTNIPSSHTFFYLEDDMNQMWKTTVTITGEFTTELSHEKSQVEDIKPIYFYDSYNKLLVRPTVTRQGIVELREENTFHGYDIRKSVRPIFLNEFRFVKKVYALELGRKTLILKQTYKAYMTDRNRKLGRWNPITENSKYYIYFTSDMGQIRLVVRELGAQEGSSELDRFTSTYLEGAIASLPSKTGMYLVTEGINPDFLPIGDINGDKIAYVITADERGVLVAEEAFIAAASSRSID